MADIVIGGQVGEVRGAAGVGTTLRQGPYSELVVNDVGLGRYFEAARLGRVFYLSNQAQTMATTHNTPLAAASATPIVGIQNPTSSGKAAVVLWGWFASVSGTPGPQAHPVWNYGLAAGALSTNPAGTIQCGRLDTTSPSMKAYNNVALTGLGVATGQVGAIRPFGQDMFAAAFSAALGNGMTDEVAGAIVVPPGALVCILAGTTAGTSWVVSAGMCWAEVDWPL